MARLSSVANALMFGKGVDCLLTPAKSIYGRLVETLCKTHNIDRRNSWSEAYILADLIAQRTAALYALRASQPKSPFAAAMHSEQQVSKLAKDIETSLRELRIITGLQPEPTAAPAPEKATDARQRAAAKYLDRSQEAEEEEEEEDKDDDLWPPDLSLIHI